VGDALFKYMIFGAALIFVSGPGSVPVLANGVPLPPQITERSLGTPLAETVKSEIMAFGTPREIEGELSGGRDVAEVMAPGSQLRVIEFLGRTLALSLMRADRTGLAVLSVPKRSVIGNLPEIAPEEFRTMVVEETGCRAVGRVQVVGSRRGAVALATGLACS